MCVCSIEALFVCVCVSVCECVRVLRVAYVEASWLAHVDVMVRNLSWPAVSHICSFTFSPFTSIVRILKSTPIVVMYVPAGGRRGGGRGEVKGGTIRKFTLS